MRYVSVGVPAGSPEDLQDFVNGLDPGLGATAPATAHPFDGITLVQTVLPLTIATVSVLRSWINARRDARKEYRIVADGIDISGYSAKEAERVMRTLLDDDQGNEQGDGPGVENG